MTSEPRCRSLLRPLLALSALLGSATPLLAHSDDAVVLENGNTIDGEVKRLDHNVLSFGTPSAGTLSVDWSEVLQLTAPSQFRVEDIDGVLYFGKLLAPPRARVLVVETASGRVELKMERVFAIRGVDTSFWDKVSGSLSFGFSYTKASDVTQLSFAGAMNYIERMWRAELTVSSITTTQEDADDTGKNDLNGSYRRSLGRRWFGIAGLQGQQNTALGLDLRASAYGGGGRRFIQTNTQLFSGWAGLAASHEEPSGVGESTDDLSGVISFSYEIFDSDSPSTSVNTTVSAYPYITDSGRWRVDYNLSLRKEVIADFFWDLSFYANYDNQPPSLDADTSDYGIITSLGYSF